MTLYLPISGWKPKESFLWRGQVEWGKSPRPLPIKLCCTKHPAMKGRVCSWIDTWQHQSLAETDFPGGCNPVRVMVFMSYLDGLDSGRAACYCLQLLIKVSYNAFARKNISAKLETAMSRPGSALLASGHTHPRLLLFADMALIVFSPPDCIGWL
jgi:hypothetical protein